MAKYRKKPVVVEATQWFRNGDHPEDGNYPENVVFQNGEGAIVRFYRVPESNGNVICSKCGEILHNHGWIDTYGVGHTVCPGDWIITEFDRVFPYPLKPDIFAATYEIVGNNVFHPDLSEDTPF